MNAQIAEVSIAPTGQDGAHATILELDNVSKSYSSKAGEKLVLGGISLTVRQGELVCIVGPSGAGKTTLLKTVCGLLSPTSGEVRLEGAKIVAPPEHLGVVFQDYSRSLLPWLTVEANVTLPLLAKGVDKKTRTDTAHRMLEAVGIPNLPKAYPYQLSGGMQQRVAIARALAYQPHLLLMDEPFASVDAQTRADLEDLTLKITRKFGITTLLVTHDIDEAVYLGDRVVVLSGTPTTVRTIVDVELGAERDQINTKCLPEFAALRARVFSEIKRQPS